MPPLSPAMAPPVTSIALRSENRFLPSESATASLSRMARSERPYGDSVIRRAIVTALRARDAGAAIESMRTHLTRVAGHLLGETR